MTLGFKRRQRGFGLIEISLGLIVVMVLSMQAMKWQARKDWLNRLDVVAEQSNEVAGALSTYITNNYGQLVTVSAVVSGYANPMAPTITELKTPPNGPLNQGFTTSNGLGGNWVLAVVKVPAGCVSPSCDLLGTVALSSPILVPGTSTIDEDGLGAMLKHIGADACYSTLADPTHCTSANGVTIPNPLGNVAGIFAIKTNFGSSGLARFYARDGSTGPLTANLLMGGNAITGLIGVSINGVCTKIGDVASGPNGEVVSCINYRWKTQGSAYWQDPVQTYAILTSTYPCNASTAWQTRIVQYPSVGSGPRGYTCDGVSWFPLALDDAGNLVIAGNATIGGNASVTGNLSANTLRPTLEVTENSSCAGYQEGTIAQSTTTSGILLSCQYSGGAWLWKKAQNDSLSVTRYYFQSGQNFNIGVHKFCALSLANTLCHVFPAAAGTWQVSMPNSGACYAICFD